MVDNSNLYGSIKLNKETVFMHNLSKDEKKLELFNRAVSEGKITNFDQVTLLRLRKLYYSFYSGLIYMFYEPTKFNNIGNKLELLTFTMEDKEYKIVHGDTDSTRDIEFYKYGVEHLDFNSWLEVEEGHKVFVYDLFSMLKFEKDIYYQLENPKVEKTVSKEFIVNHPAREDDYCKTYHNGFDHMLIGLIPEMEKNMETHPFSDILIPEITRFKQEIDFEKIVLDFNTYLKRNHK